MKEIRDTIRNHKGFTFMAILLLLLVSLPLYKQGIVCNDELLARFWGMQGVGTFYKHYFQVYLDVGRPLSAPVNSLTMYLGFIGDGSGGFRIFQIATIWLDAGLFSVFLYKLLRSRSFALVCGLSAVAFLPIVFEHSAPNAFNALLNLPFAILLLSLILFVDYLDGNDKKKLVLSVLLFFVDLTCYEAFIMYVPLYWCLVLRKDGIWDIRRFVRKCMYPAMAAVVFLVLYVAFRFLVPTEYDGIKISGFSLKSAWEVVWQLFQASFPGYYLFVPEYRQQAREYSQPQIEGIARILLVCILFGMLLFYLLKQEKETRGERRAFWGYLGAGLMCIVLPTFPNAAAKMYQESVGGFWRAVPVTYFCYFGAIFVCCFCVWRLLEHCNARMFAFVAAVGAAAYLLPIQLMNDVFAQQQSRVFQRLMDMEALFSTELAESFEGKDFYSTDLFQNRNILAVHDSYWDDFADAKGCNVKVTNSWANVGERRIYYDDSQYAVWAGEAVCILTSDRKEGYGVCQYDGIEPKLVHYQDPLEDNGFYEYYYKLSEGELQPVDREVFLAELSEDLVGNTLEGCRKLKGYYEDGWLAKESQFLVMSGDEGRIELEIYCPPGELDGQAISVYVDGVFCQKVLVQGESQAISVDVRPDRLIRLGLESNFVQENQGEDERELAVLLTFMQGH